MTTEELLNKYRKLLSDLLAKPPEVVKFTIYNRKKYEYVELTDLCYQKYSEGVGGSMLDIRILDFSTIHPTTICAFRMDQLHGCCGVVVSFNAMVFVPYRRKGIGKLMNTFRIEIARLLGYSLMICTDIKSNTPQRVILEENGWRDLVEFQNKRTDNIVYISSINL